MWTLLLDWGRGFERRNEHTTMGCNRKHARTMLKDVLFGQIFSLVCVALSPFMP